MKVYIDGENFRQGLTELLKESKIIKDSRALTSYPIRKLIEDVLAENGLELSYYASKIKLPKGFKPSQETLEHVEKIQEFNRFWVPNLARQEIEYVKAGSLKVKVAKPCRKCHHKQEVLQEKGVDVRLAVDMLKDVVDGQQKVVAVFSSDTDLCPALHEIKRRKAKVVYICFSDRTNRAISAVAHETVSISTAKVKYYGKT